MAACTLVYLTYLKAGDHLILFHDITGRTGVTGAGSLGGDPGSARMIRRSRSREPTRMFSPIPSQPSLRSSCFCPCPVPGNTPSAGGRRALRTTLMEWTVVRRTKALGGHNDLASPAGGRDDYDNSGSAGRHSAPRLTPIPRRRGLKTLRSAPKNGGERTRLRYLSQHPAVTICAIPG
jgi:hypothetical protein